MSLGTFWTVAAALLLALEMKTGEFTLATLAIGCVLAAGLAWLGFGFPAQAVAAAITSILATAVLAPWLRRTLAPATTPDPVQGMVGEEAEVLEAVAPERGGKVKLNGVTWDAVAETPIAPGTRVLVMEVDGARLLVMPSEHHATRAATRAPEPETDASNANEAGETRRIRGQEEPPTFH